MQKSPAVIISLGVLALAIVLGGYFWWSSTQKPSSPAPAETTIQGNTTPEAIQQASDTPQSSVTLAMSPTPELPAIPLKDFFSQCGKATDLFVSHINTYTDQALDDETWVATLNSQLDGVEKSCTSVSISDSNLYPTQVLYLGALATQKYPEAISLFRQGVALKETTVILAAISKYRDAANLLIGASYYASNLAGITPPAAGSTQTPDEKKGEEAMNAYVIACSPATEDLMTTLGSYTDTSLTDTTWVEAFNGTLDAFDQACGTYSVTTPPLALQAVDYILRMGSQKCAEASLTLREAAKNGDPLEFVLGNSKFNDARYLLVGAVAYGK